MEFKFCPKCGGDLEKKGENLLVCKKCAFNFYQNPKLCNAVIIENSLGEVLLVKRFVDPQKGFWDLPGGFVDLNETIEESVHREIDEELGIKLEEIKYTGSYFDKYLYDGVNFDTVSAIFKAKYNGTEFESDGEISEIKFFKRAEVPWDKIAFPSMAQALKDYIEKTGA